VNAFEKPEADFTYSPSEPVENMDEVVLVNNSTGAELFDFNWSFSNSDINQSSTGKGETVTRIFANPGNYVAALTVKNKWGCIDTVMKTINVSEDFALYVPNVFTPNADQKNEVFKPVMRAVKLYSLSIYDRWGTKLFETRDPETGWDGTYKGEPCKSDVYTWKLTVSSQHGESKNLTGHVSIIR
jgi:gliding motility-associated-like protein